MEITPDPKDRGKVVVAEDMGEPKSREEITFDRLLKALSDLAKGQKEMLDKIKVQNQGAEHSPRVYIWRDFRGLSTT